MDSTSPSVQQPHVKFQLSFTDEVYKYLDITKKSGKRPTLNAFANRLDTDVASLWAWANKCKKDESGNLTQELARPSFHEALKRLEELENAEPEAKLNPQQELFCQYYTTADMEFFGNGTQAYIEAYGIDTSKPNWYKSTQTSASRLLSNVIICKRINELLEVGGLNDENVDKQLMYLINQYDDKSTKLAAIREYNKLRSRITERLDHTTNGKDIPAPIYAGNSTKSV